MSRILMVTAVWGDWHIDAHVNVNLPTLLAPGNLPELARRCDVTYRLYTRRSDVDRLTGSPAMREVARIMPLEVEILAEERLANPIAAHQWAWTHGIWAAEYAERSILFLPPDVAWADGSFACVADLLDAGKKAILMTYPRVVSDTFVPALRGAQDGASGHIVIRGADMVSLSLRHLHPLMAAYCYDSPNFPIHSEMILWPVRGEGLLARVLAREVFLYDPRHLSLTPQWLMDANYDAREVVFVDDSDRLFGVSLAPIGKDVAWHMEYRRATPLTLARWWLDYDSPANDLIAATRVRWHLGPPTEVAWRRQERRSDRLIRETTAAREGLRVWRELGAMGCEVAASLLAVATGTGILPKAFPELRPAIVFVPDDEALNSLGADVIEGLGEAKNMGRLIAFLRHHVAFGTPDWLEARGPFSRSLVSAAGRPVRIQGSGTEVTINGLEVLGPSRRTGRHMIYRIAGILDPAMAAGIPEVA
jgi:fasciclin domain-containing protein